MLLYKKYLIKESDQFNPDYYTFVGDDLAMLIEQIAHVASDFKAEIIIAFLKNNSLQNEWIKANPELARLITTKSVCAEKIESLFQSCQNNPVFRQQLEKYLRERLTPEKV
jgi:hypothetical protein